MEQLLEAALKKIEDVRSLLDGIELQPSEEVDRALDQSFAELGEVHSQLASESELDHLSSNEHVLLRTALGDLQKALGLLLQLLDGQPEVPSVLEGTVRDLQATVLKSIVQLAANTAPS